MDHVEDHANRGEGFHRRMDNVLTQHTSLVATKISSKPPTQASLASLALGRRHRGRTPVAAVEGDTL
jgi:hypothetical protein